MSVHWLELNPRQSNLLTGCAAIVMIDEDGYWSVQVELRPSARHEM